MRSIEGAELGALKSIDWELTTIWTITVEYATQVPCNRCNSL